MEMLEFGDGEVLGCVFYDECLIGDFVIGVLYGGVVMVLFDFVSGAAVMSHPTAAIRTGAVVDEIRRREGESARGRGDVDATSATGESGIRVNGGFGDGDRATLMENPTTALTVGSVCGNGRAGDCHRPRRAVPKPPAFPICFVVADRASPDRDRSARIHSAVAG